MEYSSTMSDGRSRSYKLRLHNGPLTDDRLMSEIHKVYRICFARVRNVKHVRSRYEKGLSKLRMIIRRITLIQLKSQKPKILVHCSVRLLIYYQNVIYNRESICNWKLRRQYRMATNCYLDLLTLYVSVDEPEVVSAVVDVIENEDLFVYHNLPLELLNALMSVKVPGFTVINALWDKVEDPETTVELSRGVIRTLYEFMDSYDWPPTQETARSLERLLSIYRASIGLQGASRHKLVKKGLKICLQRTVEHLDNDHILLAIRHMCSWAVDESIRDEDVLEFGSSLEYAAFKHETNLFAETLTADIFSLLTRMIASLSRLVSLLGNRVMQYLLDRGDNRSRFETPEIFFEDTQYDINLRKYQREDKLFLKNNRAELHDSLIKGMLYHCETRLNLESSYCTICLLAVEVPCGFTAAALVCLVMNLQDRTMEREDIRRQVTFHIHACVIAVLSLLCWIHGAKVFYQYVNKIMMERAQWAPHLNPPIQSHYYFATHHVLWDKPELFFVDWEARYGLWKCFRLLES